MAQTNVAVRLTPLAALIDTYVEARLSVGLGTYLAIARLPGAGWKSYDEIAEDLTAIVAGKARTLNRVTVKTITETMYGIPNTRYQDVGGRTVAMPKAVTGEPVRAYLDALGPGIDLDAVRQVAAEQVQAHLDALAAAAAEQEEILPAALPTSGA